MAGLNATDIRLDDSWQLTQSANGDAPTASGFECVLQDIRLEALSQEGELFYDTDWGWSLIDFIQSENDELTELEIKERIKSKMENRSIINPESINSKVDFGDDKIQILVTFQFTSDSTTYSISVSLDRISVEVI